MTQGPMDKEAAIAWLKEAAKYFDKLAGKAKEDMDFWAMSKNSESAQRIILLIQEKIK